MADEIAVAFITGKTLTVDVFQPDGTEREFAVSLTEAGQGLLYLGDCATITEGDLIVAMEGTTYIGAEIYENLDARFDEIETDLNTVVNVIDDTPSGGSGGSSGAAKGVLPEGC